MNKQLLGVFLVGCGLFLILPFLTAIVFRLLVIVLGFYFLISGIKLLAGNQKVVWYTNYCNQSHHHQWYCKKR